MTLHDCCVSISIMIGSNSNFKKYSYYAICEQNIMSGYNMREVAVAVCVYSSMKGSNWTKNRCDYSI